MFGQTVAIQNRTSASVSRSHRRIFEKVVGERAMLVSTAEVSTSVQSHPIIIPCD